MRLCARQPVTLRTVWSHHELSGTSNLLLPMVPACPRSGVIESAPTSTQNHPRLRLHAARPLIHWAPTGPAGHGPLETHARRAVSSIILLACRLIRVPARDAVPHPGTAGGVWYVVATSWLALRPPACTSIPHVRGWIGTRPILKLVASGGRSRSSGLAHHLAASSPGCEACTGHDLGPAGGKESTQDVGEQNTVFRMAAMRSCLPLPGPRRRRPGSR
jgi:hypothetical protein